uniref:Replication protein C n=1 Tax=Leptospirillum sp. Group II '5-way CG' TaxID=419541 RepID=B6AQX9_9BACT|nr:MAG: replication protein C [Leptospirillum sp. Group II '5-way CG']
MTEKESMEGLMKKTLSRLSPKNHHFAKMDTSIGVAGLFHSVRGKNRPKVQIDHQLKDRTVRYLCWEVLGELEQSVFLAILELAARNGKPIPKDPKTDIGKAMRKELSGKDKAENLEGKGVLTTYRELLMMLKKTDGKKNYLLLKDALERLSRVRVEEVRGEAWVGGMNLISVVTDGENIGIGVNWRIAEILDGGRFVKIDRNENLSLNSDIARIIHVRLSSWMNSPPHSRTVGLDTLAEWVWGTGTNSDSKRQHRTRIRKALSELMQKTKWKVDFRGETAVIERPDQSVLSVTPNPYLLSQKPVPSVTNHRTDCHAPVLDLQEPEPFYEVYENPY